MNRACELCKGACCKLISFPASNNVHLNDYFTKRGQKTELGFSLECTCPHLTDGKCGIQENKPLICQTYEVGSAACRNAVKLMAKHPKRVLDEIDKQQNSKIHT